MRKIFVALMAGSALALPQLALAQDADAAAEDDGGIQEIVVTAQKRSESLSKVPISIAAVSGQSLENNGTANLEQVASSVPNLRITQTGIANRISIRGISSGDNKGFEQSAAMFVDGIYFGRDQMIRMPLVDVQRVEVLRGPQPTLFGKNAIAGAISVINKTPGHDWEGAVTGSYEFNQEETQLTGIISGPLFSDNAGVRLVGYYRKQGGFINNVTLNRKEPSSDTYMFRGTLALGSGSPVSVKLKLEAAKFDSYGQARENFNPRGTYNLVFSGPRYVETNLDGNSQSNGTESHNKVFNSALDVDIELGTHTLTLVSGYVHYTTAEVIDVDYTGLHILDGTNQGEKYDQISQEIRLTSPDDGPLKYIIGGYFQDTKLETEDHVLFGSFWTGLGAPFSRLADSSNDRVFSQTSTLWSGFAQATYSPIEKLHLTAGIRVNHESKSGNRTLKINAGPTNPWGGIFIAPDAIYPVSRSVLQATFEALKIIDHSISGSFSETSTTPMVNVQYDVTPELMAYGSYAKGVKAGGFDIRSNSLPTTPGIPGAFQFLPEHADNFEGGIKYRGRSLAFSLAYYNTRYKDLQTNVFDGVLGFNVRNASAARVQGVEADGRVAIGDHLTLSGSVAYLDFKYTNWLQGQCGYQMVPNVSGGYCDYTGQRAVMAPKWTGNAAADFTYPVASDLKISLNVNVDFSSSYHTGNILDTYSDQPAYAKLGARIGLGHIDGNWEVAVIGRNLTNERIILTAGTLPLSTTLTGGTGTAYTGIFDRPRNIAVQVQANF